MNARRGLKPRFPEQEIGRIVERLAAGERSADVAAEYGLKGDSLRTTLRRRGIVVPKPARPETPHGLTRYRNGCRCDVCTRAKTIDCRRWRAARRGTEPPQHGASAYSNYGCRCDVCSSAWAAKMRAAHSARMRARKTTRMRTQSEGAA